MNKIFRVLLTLVGFLPIQSVIGKPAASQLQVEEFLKQKNFMDKVKEWKVVFAASEIFSNKFHDAGDFQYQSNFIDSDRNGKMNEADQGFFNPASTVKTAIACLILETLNQKNFELEALYRSQNDEQWRSFGEDLEKMQVLSDNEATNRLILFLGFDEITNRLKSKGIVDFSIDRLMLGRGSLIVSPAYQVMSSSGFFSFPEKRVYRSSVCEEAAGKIGNCASMGSLIEVMKRLTNPEIFQSNGFDFRESDRVWLLTRMSQTPKELGYDYPDDWNRFLSSRKMDLVGMGGKLISKGGVALWSKTWTDQSYLVTASGRRIHLVIAVRPPEEVTQKEAFAWMADLAVEFTRWMGHQGNVLDALKEARREQNKKIKTSMSEKL